MMKFLVDENVDYSIIEFLRNQGYNTKSVSELYPARDDIFIYKEAHRERRIIITNDKDFGYLVFKTKLSSASVILLRFDDESPSLKIKALKYVLKLPKEKLINSFIVVSEKRIRIRPLDLNTN